LLPYLQNLFHCFAFGPLLKRVPRTVDHITLAARLKMAASLCPTWLLIIYFVIFSFLFAFSAYQTFATAPPKILPFAALILVGWLMIYIVSLLRAKFKPSSRADL
jgi:uncharacterized membrane protein